MRIELLKQLIESTLAISRAKEIYVFGSCSLYASYPELDLDLETFQSTYDVDFLVDPMDLDTSRLLIETLGNASDFNSTYGGYLDLLQKNFPETLPNGWKERIVPFVDYQAVYALHPLDLILVKLLIGREKDLRLVRRVVQQEYLSIDAIRAHYQKISMEEREMFIIGLRLQDLDQEMKQGK